jgi:ethanolamine ammonia-lyase small subunit
MANEEEMKAIDARVKKLKGRVEEAARLEQDKVELLRKEGKVKEALALARKFGHEPHDIELRKEQVQRLKLENVENDPSFNAARVLRMRDARDANFKALDAAVIKAAKAVKKAIAISEKFADLIRPHLPEKFKSTGVEAIKGSARRIRKGGS